MFTYTESKLGGCAQKLGEKNRLLKLKLYFSFRSFRYFFTHPIRVMKNVNSVLFKSDDYIAFVATLLNLSHDKVELLVPKNDQRLVTAFRKSISPRTEEMPLSYEEAISLYLICRILKPEHVVETGVSAGRSSAFILAALEDNDKGELISIDPDPNSGYAIPKPLRSRWKFINGKSEEVLPSILDEIESVDLFLHDSLHMYDHMLFEYRTVWLYIKNGGILVSDDIDFNRAFSEFAKEVGRNPVFLSRSFAGIRK